MSLVPGFASLSSSTLQYLQDTVKNGRLIQSFDEDEWQGTGFAHLLSASVWSPAFECFLLDEGLSLDLHSPCREPKVIGNVCVSVPSPPAWLNGPGIKFGCVCHFRGDKSSPRIVIDSPHKMWPLGFQCVNQAANFVHLFSGGFGGWTQVQQWLSTNGLIPEPFSSICVDADYNACMLSQLSFGYQLLLPHEGDVPLGRKVIVHCPVEEPFWLRALRSGQNLLASISFPCQPFSQGGRKNGLDTKEGKAVIEAAAMMRLLQPVAIALENVPGFRKHHHASIILKVFRWAGFVLHWEQIHELGAISTGLRERWLAVLIRRDCVPQCRIGSFSLQCWDKPSWNDEIYHFAIAPEIRMQLKITDDLKQFYAVKDFLPKSKQHGTPDNQDAVLKARCPKQSDQLATLVANYSCQHSYSLESCSPCGDLR